MIIIEEIYWKPIEGIYKQLGKHDANLLVSDGEGNTYAAKYEYILDGAKKFHQVAVFSTSGGKAKDIKFYCLSPFGPHTVEEL